MHNDEIYQYEPLWGEWKIKEQIGQGSIGKVYSISKNVLGIEQISAVKFITIPTPEHIDIFYSSNEFEDSNSKTDFYYNIVQEIGKEVNLLYILKGHSNIISFEDSTIIKVENEIKWHILIKMEYAISLKDHLKTAKLFEDEIIDIGIDICKALIKCHENNIIHRDIKEANVFRSQNGTYKLGDFSVSKNTSKTTFVNTKVGTLDCMPPEVFSGQTYNQKADIYSLGLMLYRLVNNNRLPFMPKFPDKFSLNDIESSQSLRMSGKEFNPPQNASKSFTEIILKACAFDPNNRFEDAISFEVALQSLKNSKKNTDKLSIIDLNNKIENANKDVDRSKSQDNKNSDNKFLFSKNKSVSFIILFFAILAISLVILNNMKSPKNNSTEVIRTTFSNVTDLKPSNYALSTDNKNTDSDDTTSSNRPSNSTSSSKNTPTNSNEVVSSSNKAVDPTSQINLSTSLPIKTTSVVTPGPYQVIIYELSNFEGKSYIMDAADYHDLNQYGYNDFISSIKIGSSVKVTIYSDWYFEGSSEVLQGNTKYLNNIVKDNTISSIKIQAMPKSNQVVLFENMNYAGKYLVLDIGEYTNLETYGFNDITTSVYVGSNVSVTLYENSNFDGKSEKLLGSDDCLVGNVMENDMVSSLKVQRTSQ